MQFQRLKEHITDPATIGKDKDLRAKLSHTRQIKMIMKQLENK